MDNARHRVGGSLEQIVRDAVFAGGFAFFGLLEHSDEGAFGRDGERVAVDPRDVGGPGIVLDN
eukprot:11190017-Lingulodinium_polyedra.AAC.1